MPIIAFDPGETIGVAILANEWPPQPASLWTGELAWNDTEALCTCWPLWVGFSGEAHPDAIIIETFKLFPHLAKQQIGSEFPAVQVIGQLRLLAHQTGLTPCLIFQQPDVQKMWSDEKLQKLGLTLYGLSPHEKSALRHCVHYLRSQHNKRRRTP